MNKFYSAIMGLVVGDALGVPFEFAKRDTFTATDMIGYGTYNQPVGTWSDDSSMTMATVTSLAKLGKIDLHDIMINFYKWYRFDAFTPYGKVFDIGNTTKAAINRFLKGESVHKCGGDSVMNNGNGSLMRILPLAFIDCNFQDIYNVSSLTHAHDISKTACAFYVNTARNLIRGRKKLTAIYDYEYRLPKEFNRIRRIYELSRDDIRSTGYVIDTLEAALWCFLSAKSYKECVLTAVNLGEDTDTVAAIAGGLAGIYYGIGGENGIPEEWIEQIAQKDWIKLRCDEFESKFNLGECS